MLGEFIMDRTSLIGILFGIIAVGVGMALKGISPLVILNPAAVIIIFLGTIASVTMVRLPVASAAGSVELIELK